jgi:hypothetical protein
LKKLLILELNATSIAQVLLEDLEKMIKKEVSIGVVDLMGLKGSLSQIVTDPEENTLLAFLSRLIIYLEDYPREKSFVMGGLSGKAVTTAVYDVDKRMHRSFLRDRLDWLYHQTICPNPAIDIDFIISCEDISIPCHKWVVTTRWSYVKRALEFQGAEFLDCRLDMSTVLSPQLIQPFIYYLYTNCPSKIDKTEWKVQLLNRCEELGLVNADGLASYGCEAIMFHLTKEANIVQSACKDQRSMEMVTKVKKQVSKIAQEWLRP